jgi:hypothetical protein
VFGGSQGWFGFDPRFDLIETSGESGATVLTVTMSTVDGSDETGQECWRDPIRVEPAGTVDVFDAGYDSLGYCAPDAAARSSSAAVTLTVKFKDDFGATGTVSATAMPPH